MGGKPEFSSIRYLRLQKPRPAHRRILACAMQPDPVFESLKHPDNLCTLTWQLPLQQGSYGCPYENCGELIKPDPLDTPVRNFRELAEVGVQPC